MDNYYIILISVYLIFEFFIIFYIVGSQLHFLCFVYLHLEIFTQKRNFVSKVFESLFKKDSRKQLKGHIITCLMGKKIKHFNCVEMESENLHQLIIKFKLFLNPVTYPSDYVCILFQSLIDYSLLSFYLKIYV